MPSKTAADTYRHLACNVSNKLHPRYHESTRFVLQIAVMNRYRPNVITSPNHMLAIHRLMGPPEPGRACNSQPI